MNFLKKGPGLRPSELKVPDFVADLYFDLKDRHLLPLVALLIVAIVAAPIYFRHSSKSTPTAIPAIPGPAASASSNGDETLTVARSEPGLRDYKRRLAKDRALDPFRPAEAGTGGASAGEGGESSTEEGTTTPVAPAEANVVGEESAPEPNRETSTESPVTLPGASEPSGAPESTDSGDGSDTTRTRYATDLIDVRIITVPHDAVAGKSSERQKAEPKVEVRRELPELTMLPARDAPAATYMGVSNDGKKALFLISSDVLSMSGKGKCLIGSKTCGLLALEAGQPETIVYSAEEHTYRIELLGIERTYSIKPHRAALGKPKEGHHRSEGSGQGEGGDVSGGSPVGSEPAGRGNG